MPRRSYSDSDRARVFVELQINEGNIKRTARNLDMPVSTVRYFKTLMNEEGLSEGTQAALPDVIESFAENAERVRDKLLVALEKFVDEGEIKPREIVPALGMLQDKIRAIRGLDTKKVEHTFDLPTPEEVRELFGSAIGEIVGAARDRAAEIEDAEWEPAEPKALSPSSK